jgi:hypothetical protein
MFFDFFIVSIFNSLNLFFNCWSMVHKPNLYLWDLSFEKERIVQHNLVHYLHFKIDIKSNVM